MQSIPGQMQLCEHFEKLEGDDKVTLREYCLNHKLKKTSFWRLLEKNKELKKSGINNFRDTLGRPPILDSLAKSALVQSLINKKRAQKSQKAGVSFGAEIRAQCEKSHDLSGNAGTAYKVSSRTVNRIKQEINASSVVSQTKSEARIFAESDPRNNFTMAAMLYAFTCMLVPYMIFNWDATQYSITEDTDKKVIIIKQEGDNQPATSQSAGTVAVSIKHFHFHNAAAEVAPPVFLIADDSLGPEDFPEPIRCGDLGASSDISSYGWICFTKTRNGNKAFYDWFVRGVVCPFICQVREKHADLCKVQQIFLPPPSYYITFI